MTVKGADVAGWQPLLAQVVTERYPRLLARARLLVASRAEAYVRRAIVTCSIDTGRRRASDRRTWGRLTLEREPVTEVAVPGLAPEVEAALAGLAPRERACVVLRHLEDMSVRDAAAQLRLSEGAVKRYAHDGVTALNGALGTTESRDIVPVTIDDERHGHARP